MESTKAGWRVAYKDSIGKRRYRSFKKNQRLEAEKFEIEMRRPKAVTDPTEDEKVTIANLRKISQLYGVNLFEASEKLLQIIKQDQKKKKLLNDAVLEYINDCHKRKLSKKTIGNYERYCKEFANYYPDSYVGDIEREQVLNYIFNRYEKDRSRQTIKVDLMAFFRWCESTPRVWCKGWDKNMTWKRQKTTKEQVKILTPNQMTKALLSLRDEFCIAMVFMGFAGIRPEEIVSEHKDDLLKWEDINFERRIIHIRGVVSKVDEFRNISVLPDQFWTFISQIPKDKRKGKILNRSQSTYRRERKKAVKALKLRVWPQDVLRHSFGTYSFHHGDMGLEKTMDAMGHKTTKMLFRHYKGLGDEETAKEWFQILENKDLLTKIKTCNQPNHIKCK